MPNVLEFFTKSSQYKNANIAYFVLAVPSERNSVNEAEDEQCSSDSLRHCFLHHKKCNDCQNVLKFNVIYEVFFGFFFTTSKSNRSVRPDRKEM